MFEHKHQDIRNLLHLFRNGQYENYQYYINGIAHQYNADFSHWLKSVGTTEPEEPEDTDCPNTASGDFRELIPNHKKCRIEDSGESYFYLYVKQKADRLVFNLESRKGITGLYVSHENWPSPLHFDYADTDSGSQKNITIESPEAGTYYMVHVTHSGARSLTLEASFEDKASTVDDRRLISGQSRHFHIDNKAYFYTWVPENSHWLYLTLTGNQGQNSLYVMRNGWPDDTRFDQSSTLRGTAQYLLVSPVESGNYYHIMVETDKSDDIVLNALIQ
jgi:glucan-binding YG repeat protein